MNEHTWEKLDADMRSDMADEYIQERCPHEDLFVNDITVKVQSNPIGSLEQWQKYLATQGTQIFELYAYLVCEKCGATQEQYIDVDSIIDTLTWEWEE
jgi:protein-arginine kinase activator protein McsA